MSPRPLIALLSIASLAGSGCEAGEIAQPPTETSVGVVVAGERPAPPIDVSAFIASKDVDRVWDGTTPRAGACTVGRAGVVNHHAPASDLMAEFFRELARCRPDVTRVIVISPDHFQASGGLASQAIGYRDGTREITADAASVGALTTVARVPENEAAFRREHGVGVLVPFLGRALPDAKIVPIMLDQRVSTRELASLKSWLGVALKDPHTFVIVSADFSHYRSAAEARHRDAESVAALARSDAAYFRSAGDTITDSGKTIALVLDALGATEWRLLNQANSAAYGSGEANTTGYITGFWD